MASKEGVFDPNKLVNKEIHNATKEYNEKKLNVEAQQVADEDIYKQSGKLYFDELKRFLATKIQYDADGKLITPANLRYLFNYILIKRLEFIKSTKINDDNYIYGLTIRMPKDNSGVKSCTTTGTNSDFLIPNEDWSKLVEQYKNAMKERGYPISTVVLAMIDAVTCERRLCKDGRWKSSFYLCPGSSGSETIYPWLQTGSKGGSKTKRRNPRKSKRRPKRRRTRRLKK